MHVVLYTTKTITALLSRHNCDKVYHKQEVHILLYILGQIVTWQYFPNPLD